MRLLRSGLFNLLFYGVTAATSVFGLPLMALPRRWMVAYLRGYAALVLWLLRQVCDIRLTILGAERMPTGGAALIAGNHQSAMDTLVWLRLLPDPAYVLKRELLAIPLWGWYARKVRMIAVDRAAGSAAMRQLMRDGAAAAAAGRQIVIFPEGTRVAPGGLANYHPGVVALAAATRLPVIPVATDSGRCWGRKAFRKQPGIVSVWLLPALPKELPRAELLVTLAETIRNAESSLSAGQAGEPAAMMPPSEAEPPGATAPGPCGKPGGRSARSPQILPLRQSANP